MVLDVESYRYATTSFPLVSSPSACSWAFSFCDFVIFFSLFLFTDLIIVKTQGGINQQKNSEINLILAELLAEGPLRPLSSPLPPVLVDFVFSAVSTNEIIK